MIINLAMRGFFYDADAHDLFITRVGKYAETLFNYRITVCPVLCYTSDSEIDEPIYLETSPLESRRAKL